jgi:hypothetical protein
MKKTYMEQLSRSKECIVASILCCAVVATFWMVTSRVCLHDVCLMRRRGEGEKVLMESREEHQVNLRGTRDVHIP